MLTVYVLTNKGVREESDIDTALKAAGKNKGMVWVDLRSFNKSELLKVADVLGFHNLAVDSVLDPYTRPHLVEYEDHFHINFTIVEMPDDKNVQPSEFHVFLSDKYIVTVSRDGGKDMVDQVIDRYRDTPTVVERGSFYALYLLSELLTDSYFPLVEGLDDKVDRLEDRMLIQADESSLQELLDLKRNLFDVRRYLGPQRDVFNELVRRDFPFLKENYQIYFQDTYNRMIRVFDVIDTAREIISGALDIYQSAVSNRLNDIMKVLTIFATILGILTVITGFYGMNFEYIPGLQSRPAVYEVILVMVVIALGMLFWFKRKKWL